MSTSPGSTRRVLYAGTFDPVTHGHLWMIEQAAGLFDEVVVAVAVNAAKSPLFSSDERRAMLAEVTAGLPNVRIAIFPERAMLVREAERLGATHVLRGIRKVQDFDYEYSLRQVNEDLAPGVLSLFLVPPRQLGEVSSSFVKGLVGLEGWVPAVARYAPRPVVGRLLSRHLRKRWLRLCERLSPPDPGACEQLFLDLLARYGEPQRHYHTAEHLEQALQECERVREHLAHPDDVELAIWYHDAVYNPQAAGNEALSAELAGAAARRDLGLYEERAGRVERLIQATAHADAAPPDDDTAYILDIDLSILGQDAGVFDAYEANVWREYEPFVERGRFCERRSEILEGFLARPTLYRTEPFRDRYEARARSNLARSLQMLSAG